MSIIHPTSTDRNAGSAWSFLTPTVSIWLERKQALVLIASNSSLYLLMSHWRQGSTFTLAELVTSFWTLSRRQDTVFHGEDSEYASHFANVDLVNVVCTDTVTVFHWSVGGMYHRCHTHTQTRQLNCASCTDWCGQNLYKKHTNNPTWLKSGTETVQRLFQQPTNKSNGNICMFPKIPTSYSP
jgi:hypothetical protein